MLGAHPVCKQRKQKILEVIYKEGGEKKLFHEWCRLINSNLPPSYRFNERSLSRILGAMSKSGYFILKKEQYGIPHSVSYSFVLTGKMFDDKEC